MKNLPQDISIEEFDYPLPDERIAKHPLRERDACKLLVRSSDGSLSEHVFSELPGLLPSDSILIYNNTRVINARLRFRKASGDSPSANRGALIEIFCLEPVAPADYAQSFASTSRCSWTCFVGNSKRWKSGPLTQIVKISPADSSNLSPASPADGVGAGCVSGATLPIPEVSVTLTATRLAKEGNASVVEFGWDNPGVTFSQIISAVGEIPIPPYLNRSTEASDSADYQTVYSRIEGSVAAPTAGLHFTDRVLDAIDSLGIPRRELTLHVGAGTFQPVKSETIGDHPMHSEFIAVPLPLLRELQAALSDGDAHRRIVAVGTTSVRTLESLYHAGRLILEGRWEGEVPQWAPYEQSSEKSEESRVKGQESRSSAPGVSGEVSPAEAVGAVVRYVEERGLPAFLASTRIIIAPGYRYRIVGGMVTNFHQPKSTLLLLVSAFTGGDWLPLYRYALGHGFRFLSYGDACLLL